MPNKFLSRFKMCWKRQKKNRKKRYVAKIGRESQERISSAELQ